MKNSKNVETTTTAATEVITETPKTLEQIKAAQVPVANRSYKLISEPAATPKGKQRQIVLNILRAAKEPMNVEQIAKLAKEQGLTAVGGVLPSCRYHLHQMKLLGLVEEIKPVAVAA